MPDGFNDRFPLPDLDGPKYRVAWLDRIGNAATAAVVSTDRLACLSEYGINLLQQRMTFHLTRVEIPTRHFGEAFAHTMIEAELLEDWTDTLTSAGKSTDEAVGLFEEFIRAGDPNFQDQLLDPERRASVRVACRRQAKAIT